MKDPNHKPNTKLPDGAKLLKKPIRKKVGGWSEMTYDARVVRGGITWLRVQNGMGSQGYETRPENRREDWVADVPGMTVSVHDYHWNGDEFGANYGSFDNACLQASKAAIDRAKHDIAELRGKLADKNAALIAFKKVFGLATEAGQ